MLYVTYEEESKGMYECVLNIGSKYRLYLVTKVKINKKILKYISTYIAVLISDFIVINKIQNIDEGLYELDMALDLGRDIYAIPGNIFEYENYLANFSIKQGAIPICSKYDAKYILKEKEFNVL